MPTQPLTVTPNLPLARVPQLPRPTTWVPAERDGAQMMAD
ncbi:MAG: hypothetical protein ACI83N_002513, partial [Hydrogenophaga sp.]